MSVITAIEPQKKRSNRVSIYVDGDFVTGAHQDTAAALNLSVGQSFERDRLVELVKAETARKARESALRLIDYRDRSEAELRSRLIRKGYPEETVDEVVESLSRTGLVDDDKFSRDWVRSRTASRPLGKARLARELSAKGVETASIERALEGLDEEAEYRLAFSLASRKAGKTARTDPSLTKRLGAFLRRRGFGWDVISRVIKDVCPREADET